MQTQNTTAGRWFVRSSKDCNRFYEVAEDRGFLRCSCPAAIYRPTKPCRHIRSVLAGEALVAKPKIQQPAPTVRRARTSEAGRELALSLDV
jgi:hypothetical protein